MSNSCSGSGSGFTLVPAGATAITTQRRAYVDALLSGIQTGSDTLQQQISDLNTAVAEFILRQNEPTVPTWSALTPAPTYPTAAYVDPPSAPTKKTLDPVDAPPRPTFLSLSEIDPVNIPPWTLGEISVDIAGLPDPSVPEFSAEAPDISYPTLPTMDTLTMPDDMSLAVVSIPELEQIDFPYFDATLAEMDMTEPSLYIDIGDNAYSTRIKEQLEAVFYDGLVNGGTGLDPEVEDAIFQRESERSLQAHNDRLIKIRADWSKGHFPLPTSMLFGMISEAEMDYTNKRLDTSRDISIEQAKLAQTNTHFIIQQAMGYEQIIISWMNNVANRVLEASKATLSGQLDLFKAQIQKYNILVDVYKARVQVYDIMTNVAVKHMEVQRLKLEQAKLIGDINKIEIDNYRAQLETVVTVINKYRAEMEGAKTYLETQNLKLQGYKTTVDAFATRVTAAVEAYKMQSVRLEGEKTRVQAYAAGADAFSKRVSALKAGVDAQKAVLDAEAETNKNYAVIYDADIKAYEELIKAEVAELTATAKMYESEVSGFHTAAQVANLTSDIQLKVVDAKIKEYQANWGASLETTKLKVQQALDAWKTRFQVLETKAQVIAQVAAAALNSDAQTIHISDSNSKSENSSVTCTDQHYWDESVV